MLLRILHRTHYDYQGAINMAQHMVHLSPVQTPHQPCVAHTLTIDPSRPRAARPVDVFGNLRTFFSLQAPHETLTVEADTLVETTAPKPLPDSAEWPPLSWERVREHFRYRAKAPYDPAAEFLFASPYVPRDDAFAAFALPVVHARPAPARGRPRADGAHPHRTQIRNRQHRSQHPRAAKPWRKAKASARTSPTSCWAACAAWACPRGT